MLVCSWLTSMADEVRDKSVALQHFRERTTNSEHRRAQFPRTSQNLSHPPRSVTSLPPAPRKVPTAEPAGASSYLPQQARSSPTSTTAPAMLSRRLASRVSRPLVRLSSSSSAAVPSQQPAKQVAPQAPNYAAPWSTSQAPRPLGKSNPRFEQTAMELQPNPLSAMEMIANEPIRVVHGRKAVCDGGMCCCTTLNVLRLIALM